MQVVYHAENLVDAHLVKHALEATGIPVFVLGEYLTGAMGELPMQGLIQVCVPDVAWADARACLLEMELDQAVADPGDGLDEGLLA